MAGGTGSGDHSHLSLLERKTLQLKYLEILRRVGLITKAAIEAGVSRQTVGYWVRVDNEFRERYEEVVHEHNDRIRAEIERRAIEGVTRPVISGGRLITDPATGAPMTMQEYSDSLLMFHARARMPEYRDKESVDMPHTEGGDSAADELRGRRGR